MTTMNEERAQWAVPGKKVESVRWGYRSLGYAEGWNACVDALLAAAPATPAAQGEFGDAYQGAREDLAIWKRRALEAEAKVRHQDQIIDRMGEDLNAINGPTFMGEPVLPASPAQPRVQKLRDVLDEYERQTKALPCQHEIPERGCSTYNWRMSVIRDLRAMLAAAPAHPAARQEQGEVQRLRPVLAMVLQALDRDAAEGKAARGEMAAELRAALAASTGQEVGK